jgi:hypothetical protein
MKTATALFCSVLVVAALAFGKGHRPYGYVPDSAAAMKIAEVELSHVYGKRQIKSELSLSAQLTDDVWTVWGSLHCPDGKGRTTDMCLAGVAKIEISNADGRILSISHTQ